MKFFNSSIFIKFFVRLMKGFKSFFKKIFDFIKQKLETISNAALLSAGIILLLSSPIFALTAPKIAFFSWITLPLAVVISSVGCTLASFLICFARSKINKSNQSKNTEDELNNPALKKAMEKLQKAREDNLDLTQRNHDRELENRKLQQELEEAQSQNEDLAQALRNNKEKLSNAINRILSISEIRRAKKIISCQTEFNFYYPKNLEIKSEDEKFTHRPHILRYRGLFHKKGTLYFGTDFAKLKVKEDEARITIYGCLHNFDAQSKDTTGGDIIFAQIEDEKYEKGTKIKNETLPEPVEKKVVNFAATDQKLADVKKTHLDEAKKAFTTNFSTELAEQIDNFTKEYIKNLLHPILVIRSLGIAFEDNYPDNSDNLPDLNTYIDEFNNKRALQLDGAESANKMLPQDPQPPIDV